MTGVQIQFRLQGRVRNGDRQWDTLANALSPIRSADPTVIQTALVDTLHGWLRDIEAGAFLEALAGKTYSVSEPAAAPMPKINAAVEGYAILLITNGAACEIADDEGELWPTDPPNVQQLDQAHELATQIVRWIRDHPDDLVRRARGYAASTIRYNTPHHQENQ